MSEENTVYEEEVSETVDELTLLKQRADLVGMKYHPSIKAEKLKEKLKAFMTTQNAKEKQAQNLENAKDNTTSPQVRPITPVEETEQQKRARLVKEMSHLVRVRVTNMNPNKKDWEGEIYTVSNALGTFKKYIPFNAEDGWHVPQIILNAMKEKECQVFYDVKTPNGTKVRKGKLIKELSIEILPPLTGQELKDLAQQQAMASGGQF